MVPSPLGVLGVFAVHTGRLPTVAGPWQPQRQIRDTSYAGGNACCASDSGCTRFAWSSMHGGGANFVFCDAAVHFLPDTIANDPSQQTCSKPVAAQFPLLELYFRDDGNAVDLTNL